MKYIDEFRDPLLTSSLLLELKNISNKPMRIMEVCGSHTMAICRNGIPQLLPDNIELISGPGCPVCVTSSAHIDAFVSISTMSGIRICIFGDLLNIPGENGSFAQAKSRGAKVEIVYSSMDALTIAENNPDELIVFIGIGFETTTPGIAATIIAAKNKGIDNFTVFSTSKLMMPALIALFNDPDLNIDGLLCPGHVSSITGASVYNRLAARYNLACVVAGFEVADILNGLLLLVKQITKGKSKVENSYIRVVSEEGNTRAFRVVDDVFTTVDTEWRGLGIIPKSGLRIRSKYKKYNAEYRLGIKLYKSKVNNRCLCGEILKGKAKPKQCPMFNKKCTPAFPIGPCMVSSEGSCAAVYKFCS